MASRVPGPSAKVRVTYTKQRSPEQIAAAEAVDPMLLEFVRFLHERGNLASGLAVTNYVRRARGSRKVASNIRTNAVVMQILRDIQAQGCIQISWSSTVEPRPFIVLLTPKGYRVIEGHVCHAPFCCPPMVVEYETDEAWPVGRRQYFVAALHESGNYLDGQGVRRVLEYLKTMNLTRPQFIGLLESDGWVNVDWTTQARRSIVSVSLLQRGLKQLQGHQCGANCTHLRAE